MELSGEGGLGGASGFLSLLAASKAYLVTHLTPNGLQTTRNRFYQVQYLALRTTSAFYAWLWKSRSVQEENRLKKFFMLRKVIIKIRSILTFCCRTVSFIPVTIARSKASIFSDCFPASWISSRMKVCSIHLFLLWRLDIGTTWKKGVFTEIPTMFPWWGFKIKQWQRRLFGRNFNFSEMTKTSR